MAQMLSDIDTSSTSRLHLMHFASFSGEKIVGLMTLKNDTQHQGTCLDLIVTLPGTSGAGSVLMEQAVNQSRKWNHGGAVTTFSYNEASDKVYEKWGFEHDDFLPQCMHLNPAESESWERSHKWDGDEQLWQLKS